MQLCDSFVTDSDLEDTVVALPDVALEDIEARQGLRMLEKCMWMFTEDAPVFKKLVQEAVAIASSSAGAV